jgi:hypothetical protein
MTTPLERCAMPEKISLTAEQLVPIVHEALAELARSMNENGAPSRVIAGELLGLGAEWIMEEEGKTAAEQIVRKLFDQYFASITDQLEAEIRSKGGTRHH